MFSQLFHVNVRQHALQKVAHICVYRHISCISAICLTCLTCLAYRHISVHISIASIYIDAILMLLHIVSVCPMFRIKPYVEVTATYSNIIFLHNMRNICTICLQYDGGKVGMELGENGTYSMHGALEPAGLVAMINSTIRRAAYTAGHCQRAVG